MCFIQALPVCPIQASCDAASKEENKEKNRYVNILPCESEAQKLFVCLWRLVCCFIVNSNVFMRRRSRWANSTWYFVLIHKLLYPVSQSDDHSRVHLLPLEGVPDSDFINASFINVCIIVYQTNILCFWRLWILTLSFSSSTFPGLPREE